MIHIIWLIVVLFILFFVFSFLFGINFQIGLKITKPAQDEGAAAFMGAFLVSLLETIIIGMLLM